MQLLWAASFSNVNILKTLQTLKVTLAIQYARYQFSKNWLSHMLSHFSFPLPAAYLLFNPFLEFIHQSEPQFLPLFDEKDLPFCLPYLTWLI